MDPRFDVELIGVTKRYGAITAVDDISLRVPKASYCCLLGPSGCGKTSTLRMIAGHESASGGDVLIDGVNVAGMPPLQRGTAMMFQNYALFPHLSCRDNVAFSLRMRGSKELEVLFKQPKIRKSRKNATAGAAAVEEEEEEDMVAEEGFWSASTKGMKKEITGGGQVKGDIAI